MISDLVIIGMGSGGMVGAEFAASLGLKVAVVERGRVGGDCLWTGCVPSKALLASAKVAHHLRTADRYGLPAMANPEIDTSLVWNRLRSIQHDIAGTDDDPARFEGLGIEVIRGDARITGPHEVTVDSDRVLRAGFILVCTGSRPAVPDLPGLAEAGYLTSENFFEIERAPRSLIIIGGGPIAIEISQAMRRLGIQVTVLQRGSGILPRDEPSLVDRLTRVIVEEGVELCLEVETTRVDMEHGGLKVVHGTRAGAPATWVAEQLLVATGRKPNIEGLGLDAIGV
ncbi:MAG TPA: FAD-dependent oxidoreductase, partial [Acidimicrobiales bacterium]|nr:FAD-dependent oxidoreductase [Acidimicrobiales bacterium]